MKKIIISLLGLLFIFLCSATSIKAAENRPAYAYFEGYGLGKFDQNDTFIPVKEMAPEEFKDLPYLFSQNQFETFLHTASYLEPVPVVRYDSDLKKTGYWTSWKNHKNTNKKFFVEVDYPKNKDKTSKFVYGPFVYEGKVFYMVDHPNGQRSYPVQLWYLGIDISEYPVLNRIDPVPYPDGFAPDPDDPVLLEEYWYLDADGKKVELGYFQWIISLEPQIPGDLGDGNHGGIQPPPLASDISDSNASVILKLDDKLLTVPDITDSNRPLSPDTPNEVNNRVVASELALTQFPSNFNFGLRKVSAIDNEAVYIANQEPSSKTSEKEGIQVYDGRLTEQGYSVTAEFTGFKSKGKDSLKGASIQLADTASNLSLTDASKFSAQQKGFSLAKGTAVTTVLETDNAKFFTGNYWNETDVQLVVPKGELSVGTHEGVVVWTLQTKPSV
ncbi:hypothetical protein FACS1894192_02730 [Bacilli bacterium]|nr:hypothetical protein FACS1894192_02730 [Bacilli bacterium]